METIFFCFACITLLTACASAPIDPLDSNSSSKAELQQQCPIGYEPSYTTEVILKSDDKQEVGNSKRIFKCEFIK